ncbi:hypothetical protein [Wolbachia endosymbiont (group A) of Sphecodes monilicornis]|uniref:hypothetical protein n=1 Tax=Wolbachia endosymbiont (group A) of Sphecodes monilicornis TaxID=2954060 RepID=UPI002226125B|nr:hypothetical protein [Wolbachia endosymbiont (group A) of Sphecodes monilicornis]
MERAITCCFSGSLLQMFAVSFGESSETPEFKDIESFHAIGEGIDDDLQVIF